MVGIRLRFGGDVTDHGTENHLVLYLFNEDETCQEKGIIKLTCERYSSVGW
jgi:hypothetical protein